jgi:superoxide reductase
MFAEHWIEWISLKTDQGIQRKYLKPGEKPAVDFKLCDNETVEEAYAYCNLHGLWKA